jgi:hypothetical protein
MIATEIKANPDDDNLAHVWLASRGEKSIQYVTLCRELDDSSEDSIYVERDDQKWSSNGGVKGAVLMRDCLSLTFTLDAEISLGVGCLRVEFEIEDELFTQLREALTAVFAHTDSFVFKEK